MARRVYARRYSQAVFEMALAAKELDRWQSDLRKITRLIEDEAFFAFLASPRVRFANKAKLLSQQLGDINPLALNLVYLLLLKRRLGIIGDIADDYQRLLDSYRGLETAEVITAVPLGEEDKLKLAEHLGSVVGKKITLKTRVDPSLIGGLVARIDGKLLDGSTRTKLEALKKEMAGARR
ncbi:MAG: ATP synthase F1 subunit delta [Dehalococcoidia bacterium]|nr:MAG: ATP synthase F1 subunit delta [Dehalococcoidia bacterium]